MLSFMTTLFAQQLTCRCAELENLQVANAAAAAAAEVDRLQEALLLQELASIRLQTETAGALPNTTSSGWQVALVPPVF